MYSTIIIVPYDSNIFKRKEKHNPESGEKYGVHIVHHRCMHHTREILIALN